jgi:alkanesulfonate monooxygenase SsuD/methylene tetrahydromethanopterin reductase-like flavin-dependent oxidoreductase (luciferase family)
MLSERHPVLAAKIIATLDSVIEGESAAGLAVAVRGCKSMSSPQG